MNRRKKTNIMDNGSTVDEVAEICHDQGAKPKGPALPARIVCIYTVITLCIAPLCIRRGYFDPGMIKFCIWAVSGTLTLLSIIICDVVNMVRSEKWWGSHRTPADICAVAYLCVCVISYILSPYRHEALIGCSGWYMGLLSQILFVGLFFCVSGHPCDALFSDGKISFRRSSVTFSSAILTAALAMHLIAILQRFGFNPFFLYDEYEPAYNSLFLSTIGQITWYSSFIVLIFPIGIYVYMTADKLRARILSAVYLATFAGTVCTAYADSAYIATAVILIVMLYPALGSGKCFARYAQSLIILASSCLLTGLLKKAYSYRFVFPSDGSDELTNRITSPAVMIIIIVASAALLLFIRISERRKGPVAFSPRAVRRIYLGVIACVMVTVSYCITRMIMTGVSGIEGSGWFYFNDGWGSARGLIWRMAVTVRIESDAVRRIFGTGPDTFGEAVGLKFYPEISQMWGLITVPNAHNEWLNTLVTTGIAGLAAYLGMFISSIVIAIRKLKDHRELIVPIAAICAYAAHNFFCYQQCVCTPVIFLFMALISSKDRS